MAADEINGNGRWARITAFVALGTFCFSMMGALVGILWWVFSLSSDQHNIDIRNGEYDKRISDAANGLHDVQLVVRSQARDLNEIETQFCASDIVRNLMHAEDSRKMSLLWQKSFGTPFPTDNAYYPMICNRKTDK